MSILISKPCIKVLSSGKYIASDSLMPSFAVISEVVFVKLITFTLLTLKVSA
ncbi:MAG: hypothetical protein IJ937_04235 [Treponema sp.]|nr:hypothetical protein [Treponema sp.]